MTLVNACLYDVSPIIIKLINVALLVIGAAFLWHNGAKVQVAEVASKPTNGNSNSTDSSNIIGSKNDNIASSAPTYSHTTADRSGSENSGSDNFTLLALDYSTWILLMLVLSPLSWSHHHLALLIPFLAIIAALHNGSLPNANKLLWAALAVGCMLFVIDGETLHGSIGAILYILFYMAFYYKLVLLLMVIWEVLLAWCVRKKSYE